MVFSKHCTAEYSVSTAYQKNTLSHTNRSSSIFSWKWCIMPQYHEPDSVMYRMTPHETLGTIWYQASNTSQWTSALHSPAFLLWSTPMKSFPLKEKTCYSENLLAVNAILGMNSTANNNMCQRNDILSIRKMDYKEY